MRMLEEESNSEHMDFLAVSPTDSSTKNTKGSQYERSSPDSVANGCDEMAAAPTDERECSIVSPCPIPPEYTTCIHAAFGSNVDLYHDVFRVQASVTERGLRIAYFRRGRESLSQKEPAALHSLSKKLTLSSSTKSKFQAISMAYEILSRQEWKDYYDKNGLPYMEQQEPKLPLSERDVMPTKASILLYRTSATSPERKRKIRWSEQVEELIYTPDVEEVSFKLGARACNRETDDTSKPFMTRASQAKQQQIWLEARQMAEQLDQINETAEPSLVSSFLDDIEKGLDGLEASVDSFVKFAWSGGAPFPSQEGPTTGSEALGTTKNTTTTDKLHTHHSIRSEYNTELVSKVESTTSFQDRYLEQSRRHLAFSKLSVGDTESSTCYSPVGVEDTPALKDGRAHHSHSHSEDTKSSRGENSDPLSNLFASLVKPAPEINLQYMAEATDPTDDAARRLFHEFDSDSAMMADTLNVSSESEYLFNLLEPTPDAESKSTKKMFAKTFTSDPWRCQTSTDVAGNDSIPCQNEAKLIASDRSNASKKISVHIAPDDDSLDHVPANAVGTHERVDLSDPNFNPFGDETAVAKFDADPRSFMIDCPRRPSGASRQCDASVSTISASDIASCIPFSDQQTQEDQKLGNRVSVIYEDNKEKNVTSNPANNCEPCHKFGAPEFKSRQSSHTSILRPATIKDVSSPLDTVLNGSFDSSPYFFTGGSDVLHLGDAVSHVSSLTGKPSVVSASARLNTCPPLFSIPASTEACNKIYTEDTVGENDEDFSTRLISFVTSVSQEMSRFGESLSSMFEMFTIPDSPLDILLNKVNEKNVPNKSVSDRSAV